MHRFDELLYDRHAKTRAFDAGDRGIVDPLERMEDLLQEFFRHAHAVISAGEDEFAFIVFHLLTDVQVDLSAVFGVFDGVGQDVDIDLSETLYVAIELFMKDVIDLHGELMFLVFHLRTDDDQRVMKQFAEIEQIIA